MPGRSFIAQTKYRYGFNGKEKDLETAETTTYDYGFRIYNPGLGKFLSVDPLTQKYPELTPYQFASNRPIDGIDLDGLEWFSSKSAKVSVAINFDSKLGLVNSTRIYLEYSNLVNGLKKRIHSNLKLPGDFWDEDINPIIEHSRKIYEPPIPKDKFGEGLDQVDNNTKKGVTDLKYVNSRPNRTVNKVTRKHTISQATPSSTSNKSGIKTINKLEAYVEVVKIIGEFSLDIYIDNYELPKIDEQANLLRPSVMSLLNKGISENIIPKEFRNNSDLQQLTDYLVSGRTPTLTTPGSKKDEPYNTLWSIGKKLWSFHESELKKQENTRHINAHSNTLKHLSTPLQDNLKSQINIPSNKFPNQ